MLSWRLPLQYVWLLVLAAACSFLGYYGFAALAPATVHYLWMLSRERKQTSERPHDLSVSEDA